MTLLNMLHCCKIQQDSLLAAVSVRFWEHGNGTWKGSKLWNESPSRAPTSWYCNSLHCMEVTCTDRLASYCICEGLP